MSTRLPDIADCTAAVREWWDSLDDQERIIEALDTVYQNASIVGFPYPADVAENPWKWASKAHADSLGEPPPAGEGQA